MKGSVIAAATVLCSVGILLCGCVTTQKYTEAQSEIQALSLDKNKLAAQMADLTAKVAGAQKERDTLSDQVVKLKNELKAVQDKSTASQGNASSLQSQIGQKDGQINALNTKIEELNAELARLKKENEALKSKPTAAPETEVVPAPAPGA